MESNLLSTTSRNDIVRMATLLRDEGDKLLNFSCNLALTVEFLAKLNEAFDLIVDSVDSSCFQVINTNHSSEEFLHDLQFLHDIVQKISGLRLWSRDDAFLESIGLDKFRALQFLDLNGVRVKDIRISCARDKLKALTCSHSRMQDPQYLFGSVDDREAYNTEGETTNASQIWLSLEEIFLPYNDIKILGSFLCIMPRLKILDLSHNNLTDLSALVHSSGTLEWLNVSYNRLKALPDVSTCTKLRVILFNQNQVADITGLHRMVSLQHIDASNNLIRCFVKLKALANLKMLETLYLKGNPIAHREEYRLFTAIHLNYLLKNPRKFILDGCPLSELEIAHLNFKKTQDDVELVLNHELSGSSVDNSALSHAMVPSSISELSNARINDQPIHSDAVPRVRQVRFREASIADGEDLIRSNDKSDETLLDAGSTYHLETKRDIESLRKKFGEENWLHGGGGQRVLNILGLPLKSSLMEDAPGPSSTLPPVVEATQSQVVSLGDDEEEEEESANCERAEEVLVVEQQEDVGYEGDVEEEDVAAEVETVTEERDRGVELGIFVVHKKGIGGSIQKEDLILVVTDRFLIEFDGLSGMDLMWRTVRTLSAVSIDEGGAAGNPSSQTSLSLTFKNEYGMVESLSYLLEENEAKELRTILQGILDESHPSIESSSQFSCLKCSTSFVVVHPSGSWDGLKSGATEDDQIGDASPKCPKCGSSVVVQHFVEEVQCLPGTCDPPKSSNDRTLSGHDVYSEDHEKKDPVALWAANKLFNKMETDNEASDRGLHLHILLNILRDDEGKENDIIIQDVLVFQEASAEVFYGHVVITSDSVYVLKENNKEGGGQRRFSGDESSAPTLLEWHPKKNCLGAVEACSGYIMKFGTEPTSALWIFPHLCAPMIDVMNEFSSSLKDQEFTMLEREKMKERKKLPGILMHVPAAVVLSLTSDCDTVASSNIQHGIIILTSSAIYFVGHRQLSAFMYDDEYMPSHSRRISDLIGLDGAPSTFRELPGIVLIFSGEETEEKCVVWPWSKGIVSEFLFALQKPWEDIFSVPFEEILSQISSEQH